MLLEARTVEMNVYYTGIWIQTNISVHKKMIIPWWNTQSQEKEQLEKYKSYLKFKLENNYEHLPNTDKNNIEIKKMKWKPGEILFWNWLFSENTKKGCHNKPTHYNLSLNNTWQWVLWKMPFKDDRS